MPEENELVLTQEQLDAICERTADRAIAKLEARQKKERDDAAAAESERKAQEEQDRLEREKKKRRRVGAVTFREE